VIRVAPVVAAVSLPTQRWRSIGAVIDESEAAEPRPPTGGTDLVTPEARVPSTLQVLAGDDDLVCIGDGCVPGSAAP
jgi:hypothetical protein